MKIFRCLNKMSVTPAVLTQEVLTQREAQPVVLIQPEEILRVKTQAYSRTNSDISFMVRQPSASAILANDVELYIEVDFTTENSNVSVHAEFDDDFKARSQGNSDYGYVAEGLPIQSKCVRNAVLTINGSSQSFRMNEFGKEYAMLHCTRKYMDKIGNGWNDYTKNQVINTAAAAGYHDGTKDARALNETEAKQYKAWKAQILQDGNANQTASQTVKFAMREPLFMGPFGAFRNCDSFPAWSSEGQKSPGLLHVHNMQLQLAMEERWQNALFLAVKSYAQNNDWDEVSSVNITKAELHTRWILPPPRLISAALTQSVSYASFDVLRFVAEPSNGVGQLKHADVCEFKLNAVSFPYMPSLFVFSVQPHYAHCTKYIAGRDKRAGMIDSMKRDKRLAITHLDLVINTSSAAVPFVGTDDVQTRRINARDLYRMTLENCADMTDFPYNFEDWRESCGFVALSPAQLSGQLNSPNIRGNVVMQGKIVCRNYAGHPVNVSTQSVAWADDQA